jgi:ribosomal protein S12 methylthiotransferase accessory factor
MTDKPMEILGTLRARAPEHTWQTIERHLPAYGVTRLADLTGLDCIGLPVWTAVRPASRTLSTSQGKGATHLLAKLSAAMEAIELWHTEQPLPITARGPAAEVTPDCPVTELPLTAPHPARTLTRMNWDWTPATGLLTGQEALIPADLIRRRTQRPPWSSDLLRATSTGLACGNTRDEALLHALLEVVERDVLHRDGQLSGRRRTLIAPHTVQDPYGRQVIDRITAAGMGLEIALVDGPYELPVCLAYLWSEDHPAVFAGAGCHTVPQIALTRALTEAAQSRLAAIAGTRDDLPSDPAGHGTPPFRPATTRLTPWPAAAAPFTTTGTGLAEQTRNIAQRIARVTGHEPLAVDLSRPAGPVHAVQTVCPGTRSRTRRSMPR